jgi:hypothetical protein
MGSLIWDNDTRAAFSALKAYEKAYEQYAKGRPTPELGKVAFDEAHKNLAEALRNPKVAERIAQVLNAKDEGAVTETTVHIEELETEISFSSEFGLKRKRVHRVFKKSSVVRDPKPDGSITFTTSEEITASRDGETKEKISITTPEEVRSAIERLHNEANSEMQEARKEERKPKKARKRKIGQGITSMLFGSGTFIANSYCYYYVHLPNAAVSYSVSLAAFHQAVRDLIGEAD